MTTRPLAPGRARPPATQPDQSAPYSLPAHHLVTHGVCVGMTGSGKTGLCVVLVEEALRSRVPVLMIDVKGDLADLMLTFPGLTGEEFLPWIDVDGARRAGREAKDVADETAARWRDGLARWQLGPADVAALRDGVAVRVITPGTTAAEPLHVLSALESGSELWQHDEEAARESLSAALSLLLRMIDHEADPARSREHVLLALLAERRLRAGEGCTLETLVGDLQRPPLARVGALTLDDFIPAADRAGLAQDLNTLIASPTFSTWRQGAPLEPARWFAPRDDGRTPAVILSVAHLDDAERMLVLSLVLEQMLAWVRSLSGTSDLRALVLFDEVFGFLPPHPAQPPTKRPLLALLKQARAFGVGVVLATQNTTDIDYKALSNAGLWLVGRLQTDADRARVVEGLAGTAVAGDAIDRGALGEVIKSLPGRTFYVRNVHDATGPKLLETRWSLSWLRGPLTRQELRRLTRPAQAPAPAPATQPQSTAPAAQHAPTTAAPAGAHAPTPVAPASAHAYAHAQAPAPQPQSTAPAVPIAPTRVSPAGPVEPAPAAPEGWLVWHAPATADVRTDAWTYQPWVAATIVAHLRDAKLGVHVTRTVRAMAPLTAEGRPDTARGRVFDPQWFGAAPMPGGRHAPMPDALFRKNGPAAVARALRDEVYRSLQVTVLQHKGLGLVARPDEAPEAFAQRVSAEAARRVAVTQQEIATRHAAKLQRATDDVANARKAVADAEAALPTGGALATAAAFMRGGSRALQRLETQQDRQAQRLTKARADLADAEAALREAVARRDAELADAAREAGNAAAAVESKALAAKRDDIEVTELGVVWVPAPVA